MRRRNQLGQHIVEGAVGLVIILVLLVTLTYAILEVAHAYFIWSALQQGARQAAELIMGDPNVTGASASNPLQAAEADMAQIQIPNVIVNIAQFSPPVISYVPNQVGLQGKTVITEVPNQFLGQQGQAQNAYLITSVQVTVTYTSGQYGLPVFPDADVLHLGSLFTLQATSVCNTSN